MSSKNSETPLKDRIDWITVIVPFLAILALCVCFIMMPDASKSVLDTIRFILGDTFGLFYLAVGLFVFLLSLFLAFSRFGNIRLGKPDEKPKYPLFVWASMMFTSGLAADILFYSFCEWILYANDPHISEMGSMQTCDAFQGRCKGLPLLPGPGSSADRYLRCLDRLDPQGTAGVKEGEIEEISVGVRSECL